LTSYGAFINLDFVFKQYQFKSLEEIKMLFKSSIKNKFKRDSLTKLFLFIVAGTRSQYGFAFAPAKQVAEIQKAETSYLESVTAPAGVEVPKDSVAIKASAAGLAAADAHLADVAAAPAVEAQEAKVEFKVESGVDLPASKRGGRTATTVYPFEQLSAPVVADGQKTVYSSFLIPGKAKKSISSTVSAANKRYEDRGLKFAVRDMDGGARVFRIK
jgi:hypothetical protein